MSRALKLRLDRLEKVEAAEPEWLPVFCRDGTDFEAALAEKIRMELATEADRPRALPWYADVFADRRHRDAQAFEHWLEGTQPPPAPPFFGTHEERLRLVG